MMKVVTERGASDRKLSLVRSETRLEPHAGRELQHVIEVQGTRLMDREGSAGRADTPEEMFLFHPDHSQTHGLDRVALFGIAGDEGNCQP